MEHLLNTDKLFSFDSTIGSIFKIDDFMIWSNERSNRDKIMNKDLEYDTITEYIKLSLTSDKTSLDFLGIREDEIDEDLIENNRVLARLRLHIENVMSYLRGKLIEEDKETNNINSMIKNENSKAVKSLNSLAKQIEELSGDDSKVVELRSINIDKQLSKEKTDLEITSRFEVTKQITCGCCDNTFNVENLPFQFNRYLKRNAKIGRAHV